MTKEEIGQLAALIKTSDNAKMLEHAFKLMSTISLGIACWVLTSVNAMQVNVVKLTADSQYTRTAVTKLEAFTEKPRFTQDNFDLQTAATERAIGVMTSLIQKIEQRLNVMDLERQKIQLDIQVLQQQKK